MSITEAGRESIRRSLRERLYCASGTVYMIYSPATSAVKVGYTARLGRRIRQLRRHPMGCANLVVLAAVRGAGEHEQAIHDHLAHLRVDGEWYLAHDEVFQLASVLGDWLDEWVF